MLTTIRKIHTLSWTRDRQPIKRSKLAYEVAKKLKQYLNRMAVRSHRNGIDLGFSQRYCRVLLRTDPSKTSGRSVEVSCSSTICSWSISYLYPKDPSNQRSGWQTLRPHVSPRTGDKQRFVFLAPCAVLAVQGRAPLVFTPHYFSVSF